MLLALLLGWLFDRVITDCHAGPETVSHYVLQATLLVEVSGTCFDDQGQPYPCDVATFAAPLPFREIPDPGSGTTVLIPEDFVASPELLPECSPPPCVVGWPWFVPVVAVDLAGNRSDDVCP